MLNFYKPQRLAVFALFFFSFLLFTTARVYSQYALQFDGSNDYVTFGAATSTLGASTFTLECWVKRSTGGVTMTTGSLGLDGNAGRPLAYPVLTKGMGEGETPANINMNWFLGITSTGFIGADFEDNAGGVNHPVWGVTQVSIGEWHHIAATYDGQTWNLYLDGVLDKTLNLGSSFTPENNSIQHAALGIGLGSTGQLATGRFSGIIEEPRVWGVVRTQAEIQASMNLEVTSGTGLKGRWSLNEGTGTTATNSVGTGPNGTLTNGTLWVEGITFPPELWALQFDGTNDYVTFGQATTELGASTFTLECWFNRTGTGSPGTTGSGGITSAIPLVTKGRNQSDGSVVDMNYWLGIDYSSGTLAADFEDIDGSPIDGDPAGQNHPIFGTTVITDNVWHHAAATFDGTTWKLYLDGLLDNSLDVTNSGFSPPVPQFNSTQYAALGTALNSSGNPDGTLGFFAGIIDEARIWNVARTEQEIQDNINLELTSGSGLIGRWALDDGTGTTATNSIGGSPTGTLTNGPAWVFGAPFNITFLPPDAPTNLIATGINNVLSWDDNSDNETSFEIERSNDGGDPWTNVGSVGANIKTFLDLTASPSTQYHYRVYAHNNFGNSAYSNEVIVTTPVVLNTALDLGLGTTYVTFGEALGLGVQNFTVETWFIRTATGVSTYTGNNGIHAIPLVTKGMAQSETQGLNVNFFLGINTDVNPNVLTADFEELSGPNHPIVGTTPILDDVWYHAAVTYDKTTPTYKLYLNGTEETTSLPFPPSAGATPDYTSTQHAALGTAFGSGGTIPSGQTQGFFNGILDEVRIWNYARSQSEIQTDMFNQLTSGIGLVARWDLDGTVGSITTGATLTGFGSFTGTVMGGDASYVYSTSPLPVELSLFEGKPFGNKVNLSWRTETEVSNYGFEIERACKLDDISLSGWQKIGFVEGHGNSNSPKNYSFTDSNPAGGVSFAYRLKQIDNDGKYEYSDIIEVTLVPEEFALYQNYPNPFNPTTKIKYSVPEESDVTVKVFDILGNEVKTLFSGKQAPGVYELNFNASELASGIYLYKMQSGDFIQTKKMLLLK